jgi:ubiquitin-protein ligase
MAPISSQMTLKRIHREMADVAKEDLGLITLVPTADNLFVWKGSIPGPQGSPYEGGVFGVDVVLGNDYPYVFLFCFLVAIWLLIL